MSDQVKRRPGEHGAPPLAVSVRRRLLRDLLERAEAGSASHAEVLVRLSLEAERAAREADRCADCAA